MPELKLPGTYKAEVTDATVGTAKTGTSFVLLKLRTDEHEMCDAYLYLSEKAFERTVKTLHESLEFDGSFENIAQLRGRRCSIQAEEETDDDGKARVRVRWINPEHSPVADASFIARLSARAAQLLAAKPAAEQATPPKPATVKQAAKPAGNAVADDPDDFPCPF